MDSYDIIREAVNKTGAKKVAAAMGVSSSLVYKWCERSDDSDDTSGTRNPLDRLRMLFECTGDDSIIQWLCKAGDGYFVRNPKVGMDDVTAEYVNHTQKILKDFSDLLQVISASITDDGRIDPEEAARIRKEWEDLKRMSERFVRACEKGIFDGQ